MGKTAELKIIGMWAVRQLWNEQCDQADLDDQG